MGTRFVPAPEGAEISALTTYVVRTVEGGGWREAAILGGRSSRTGRTTWPTWIEEGAVRAVRADQIHQGQLAAPTQGADPELVYFDEQGFFLISRAEALEIYQAWVAWRDPVSDHDWLPTVPDWDGGRRFWGAVKRGTRPWITRSKGWATRGEILEGLPRRYPTAVAVVNDGMVTVTVPGEGSASMLADCSVGEWTPEGGQEAANV